MWGAPAGRKAPLFPNPARNSDSVYYSLMTRREILATAAAGSAAMAAAQEPSKTAAKNAFFELRYYRMRNTKNNQERRTSDFLAKGYVPAAKRAGIGPVGIFNALIAPDAPFRLVVSGYPSLASMQGSLEKLAADAEYQKALAEFTSGPDLAYSRMESTLFRCFDAVPAIEIGSAGEARGGRTFELRTYESNNEETLRRKVSMFNQAEVGVFRRCGVQPVFFGEALVGSNLPRLTYMVAYDSLAGRDKVWGAFSADPEWQKIRSKPEWSDSEVVSNISNSILRPAAGSEIR
jgi:hypothetical protein